MGGAGIRDAGADFAQPAVGRKAVGRGGPLCCLSRVSSSAGGIYLPWTL